MLFLQRAFERASNFGLRNGILLNRGKYFFGCMSDRMDLRELCEEYNDATPQFALCMSEKV